MDLAKKADVSVRLIRRLEKVDVNAKMILSEKLFQSTNRITLEKIEQALECNGVLRAGQVDDFLSMYMHYYGIYKKGRKNAARKQLTDQLDLFPAKAVVFDFDGTLSLRLDDDLTTWERLWVSVGYTVNDCNELARKYVKNGKVSHADHKKWCEETCAKFKKNDFTREHLDQATQEVRLVAGVRETLVQLHNAGITLLLTSGSIRDIIRQSLGDVYDLFDEVHANHLVFDANDRLDHIRGTHYDFEGKGEFIRKVVEEQDLSPLEVLFVGNSLNDIWASNSGARTLCVNPHYTNPNDARDWTYCIRKMTNLSQIIPYLGRVDISLPT